MTQRAMGMVPAARNRSGWRHDRWARLVAIVAAVALACTGAKADDKYPVKTGPHDGVVCGRRSDRHRRARHERQDERTAGPAVRGGEQDRGGRQHRRGRSRQDRARRLQPADGDGVHPRHQSRPVQQDALRSDRRFRAGRAGRRDADPAGGAPVGSRDRRQEPHCAGQGQPGEIHLRLVRASARSFISAASSSRARRAGSTSRTCPIAALRS